MGPSVFAIVIAIVVSLALPVLLHFYLHHYSVNRVTHLPTFLLVGPSGSGKTALLTLFERGEHAASHTSQAPLVAEVALPVTTVAASSRYRSSHDPTSQVVKRFLLIDTPGHGKLRHHALSGITSPQNLRGIIFVVDAANLSSSGGEQLADGLRDTAEYLHDMLLLLQKRITGLKSSKAPRELHVLVAANKSDLFTSLPAPLVKTTLETEITKVRDSRSKGLLDSGIGMGEDQGAQGDDKDWLGDVGGSSFDFDQMRDSNVVVEVAGGNVLGSEGPRVGPWWEWVGNRL
ncbi:MAG: hypothetical protein M1832_000239 [Thelocarpon impressellum]|nr:MAG: hypothetical protein M1832_000239 [Thelocarpon impressellum]